MKKLLILFYAIAAISCSSSQRIANGAIEMEVDGQMQVRVRSLHDHVAPFYEEFLPFDRLVCDEMEFSAFRLVGVEHRDDGCVLTGVAEADGFVVEKQMTVTAPEGDFGDMLVLTTRYINRGRDLHLRSMVSNELRLGADSLLWSFEPTSSSARADWVLPVRPGFKRMNYLGMNNTDYGGGIPMISLWRRDGGVSIGLVEPELRRISMPVTWSRRNDYATLALVRDFDDEYLFSRGDTLAAYDSFVAVQTGDFFDPLRGFSNFMQQQRGIRMAASEPEAFEPVWCAWGYERQFTVDEVLGTLPKVAELGFKWVDVDDGYQIAEGDWETNDRFPGGGRDMRRLTDAIHALGMKAKLWWAPLAADPGTRILREHPEMLLQTAEGTPEYITWWDSYYLSPVNPATERYTRGLVDRFMQEWNFDGLKLDGQHLNLCQPDYNPRSGLSDPEQAVSCFPSFFEKIFDRARSLKPDAVIQLCPCGCAINFFNIPYMNQAVASDPTSSWQVRLKCKSYKAINPGLAYYGDHVELTDGGTDFASQVGVGAVVGSKFTWPENNPAVKADYRLTPDKERLYAKWVRIYREKMLSQGEYLNLYDIGFDKPEGHVIRREGALYYAFYADRWEGEPVELRGLDPGRTYLVMEYAADTPKTYEISGDDPFITPVFEKSYLIEVREK
ncbi:glycoside hydrolase family 36 protein [Alistipes sp.]|uniref:glycoside hydrolase family 36 protein n=1 Tax=Alistipes sp. TaxID=1872444 RepID=UPI0025C2FBEA|nr:glycoside hydrolase family 36 protein [Alistipes sp.]